MLKQLNNFAWSIYKLTPKGKRSFILKSGLSNLKKKAALKTTTKLNIIDSATKVIKTKKIFGFNKGKSIVNTKKSNHQVRENVKNKHALELKERGLKITNTGKFRHA
ncbi:hypothetical protein M1M27_gp04 [Cellulophaga phage Ingeline_1]|uniref:Uncharacterized protein n=1 Tax=Cellulophaga phage Ingeline_1 TaxID=2745674 RepID=A0A8E5E955_9CAUD|nr:hypothetical protein M1M27_gp04 [Cellulophaga phage Ingeline_1]QQV90036.1 hypothetical protein Ingeline2_47 [Cellulophaga phage Ingeline_2]QQV90086.1 hypothetical protein Ingeline3_47 [Cellulophaga phage Ingeline_3]QQV90136.1 hypothetical protein Ingeline4_47 [Cellulophaga phage Ingeline_4]QQV90185.1 hypothetical protein Ingeline5_46 [Cellulophaga phage Ingeline_5]QQV90235.1 hypothetical protein Ingeline6_47 [Cellulophaga phage Ingeline_6]QQV90285.1 hypothetical protein Ingeline7_47 [Cellu